MKRQNCAGCENLKLAKMPMADFKIGVCKANKEAVVPQSSDEIGITFWRIPSFCPLPSDEVQHSEKPRPKKTWTVLKP